ncbi:MAG: ATP-binding protein [Syntrophomonadaceae bacterium]|jgi:predicted HTH transcriptional regulator|nr:ATP-binding protein [Syntrophomonadaceae bacterium]
MSHEDNVRKIVSTINAHGMLKSRESNTVEFKQSFNAGNAAAYARTMAAFSNNRGGYIIFGVKDNPREVVGVKANNFENFNQEKFTGAVNSLFSPEIV